MLRLELTPGKVEWVAFNPGETDLEAAGQKSRKAYDSVQKNAVNKIEETEECL